ncbi:aldehyde dehydrogenase family protein [Rhodococcus sp. USK13]|uniref:aldehyde dehydrogenase family protein n=1 Tax=Rhodococcus sp. USK13 TaxID=2806442 RepID=UPI001BCBE8DD|nr:aldehyde dehydrogenase family protein [Rhodococcus sp. USK13]
MSNIKKFEWSSDAEEDRFEVENPATGELIVVIQGGGPTEVDAAVRRANDVFTNDWRWRPGAERGRLLIQAAQVIREHSAEIAAIETRENGKPLGQAMGDVAGCIAILEYFGGLAGKLPGDFHVNGPMLGAAFLEPYGVVGSIVPFNWPPIHTAGKIAPAIAAGNTVVIKPPEQTPMTVIRVVELIQSVLPQGVVEIVPGVGLRAGAALAEHPLIKLISFTGATVTGAAVVRAGADNSTPVLLELGGKNAMVVFEDADLDLAVKSAFDGAFFNQGEACTAISRLLVHRSLHDEFVRRLTPLVEELRVGPGDDPQTQVGPMVTKRHQGTVLRHLDRALSEGAVIAAQAVAPDDEAAAFVAPTMLVGVTPDMSVARDEVFGPVLAVIPFDDEAEAIAITNDTEYGLTCSIFSSDQPRAFRVSRSVDVGMVFINNYFRGGVFGLPFGGTKGSGHGREHTIETLKEYGRWKVLSMPSGLGQWPMWPDVPALLRD